MSDVEEIRAAVSRLREVAAAATPGQWTVAHVSGQGFAVHRGEHTTVALYASRPDAEFIATMDPDLALLLADLLDAAAEAWPVSEPDYWSTLRAEALGHRQALAVARKVNR